VGLDGASGHVELLGDFIVVAALQEQFSYLLFSGTQSDKRLLHACFSPRVTRAVRKTAHYQRPDWTHFAVHPRTIIKARE
jgi:hypothetical protein